jgi:hypothetical protein|tara:strand:- start:1111 stop:1311 length:201 start_codon:yes stop_codon:yes gene_type:complete
MKYLLLSAVFSLNVEYADLTTCQTALEQVSKHDEKAICIPAGKEKSELMFEKFLSIIQKLDNQKTQ